MKSLYQQELNNTDPEKIRAVFRPIYSRTRSSDFYAPLAEVPVRVTAKR